MKRRELSESKRKSEGESESSEEDVLVERSSLVIGKRNVRVLVNSTRWESLLELELEFDVTFAIPSDDSRCFSSLKTLTVHARHPNCKFLNRLFGVCQVLEDLTIFGDLEYGGDEVKHKFIISIRTLKKLKIELMIDSGFQRCSKHRFIIQTPELEDLTIIDATLACFQMDQMLSLRQATVSFGLSKYFNEVGELFEEDYLGRLDPILQGIRYVKSLNLSPDTTAALSCVYDHDLPKFRNLVHLELGIDHFYQWKLLPYFLRSTSLETLVLNKESEDILRDALDETEEGRFDRQPAKSTPSSAVHQRVSPCLKEIRIRNLWRSEEDKAVVMFLLKNCKGLEKMSIDFD